jgi:hypothetical protein
MNLNSRLTRLENTTATQPQATPEEIRAKRFASPEAEACFWAEFERVFYEFMADGPIPQGAMMEGEQ